jgi:hypothetical protein
MTINVVESAGYKVLTGSGQVSAHAVQIVGIVCAASTSLTIKVWDSPSASGAYALNTLPMLQGDFLPLPIILMNGCFVTFGGTGEITVLYNPVQ